MVSLHLLAVIDVKSRQMGSPKGKDPARSTGQETGNDLVG